MHKRGYQNTIGKHSQIMNNGIYQNLVKWLVKWRAILLK